AILGLTALISTVPTAAAVGAALFRRRGIHGATLGGALVLGLCWLVPWLGWLVRWITIPVGRGAWRTAPGGQADLATGLSSVGGSSGWSLGPSLGASIWPLSQSRRPCRA